MQLSKKQALSFQEKIQNDPKWFVNEVLGETLWGKQIEILEAIKDHDRVAVKSGNGVGKTFISASVILWFLLAHCPSKVITTAPTWNQVEKLLWSEIATQYNKAKTNLGGLLLKTELRFDDNHFGIGFSTNHETNFQGHHSENILIVFDEALGVQPQIWVAAEGNLTSENAKMMVIGNPTVPNGRFYECFKSPLWHKITISCLDSPNVIEGETVIPGLVTRDWIEERKQEWGENNPFYKARVLGEFPIEGEDTLIPLSWVERSLNKEININEVDKVVMGIDVARYGSDSTVFTIMKSNKVIYSEGFVGKKTTYTAGRAIILAKEHNCNAIGVDDSGVGGGVTDILQEQLNNANIEVVPVNFGSVPSDKDRFDNLKAEIMWNLREEFEGNTIAINSPELLEQLPSIMYEITSKGKIKIVSKDEMKKLGIKSPDYADSLAIAHYVSYHYKNNMLDYYKEQYENIPSVIQSFV